MARRRPRSAAEVFAEAIAKAPPAYPRGVELPPVGASVNWDEDVWGARAAIAYGSVDTSAAGGRWAMAGRVDRALERVEKLLAEGRPERALVHVRALQSSRRPGRRPATPQLDLLAWRRWPLPATLTDTFRCEAQRCTGVRAAQCIARQAKSDVQRTENRERGEAPDFPLCVTARCAQGRAIREKLDPERAHAFHGVGPGGRFERARSLGTAPAVCEKAASVSTASDGGPTQQAQAPRRARGAPRAGGSAGRGRRGR